MADLVLFDPDGRAFEDTASPDEGRFWSARQFMAMLGYENFAAFERSAINKAIATCTTLRIPVAENFQQCAANGPAGENLPDYRLTRFACYLVAMNGDGRKPHVAAAQAYFARVAEAFHVYLRASEDVERVQIRDDLADRSVSLASAAKKAGVTEFALFQNAGYRGMYNMDLNRLKAVKGLPDKKRSLLDFMGKRELAGNLFRLTETEARLANERTDGQLAAEGVAFQVGRKVRDMMIENDGTKPELLRLSGDINEVRAGLKKTEREFGKLDRPKQRKRLLAAKHPAAE